MFNLPLDVRVRFVYSAIADGYCHVTLTNVNWTQGKLRRGEYPTLTTLESDLKRLVFNNKNYYPKNSPIWLDAERVRKITSDFMHKNNPAYQDPGYVAFPTPLPGETFHQDRNPSETRDASPTASPSPKRKRMRTRSPLRQPSEEQEAEWEPEPDPGPEQDPEPEPAKADSRVISPAMTALIDSKPSLAGKTFQEAQEIIVTEMIDLHDEE